MSGRKLAGYTQCSLVKCHHVSETSENPKVTAATNHQNLALLASGTFISESSKNLNMEYNVNLESETWQCNGHFCCRHKLSKSGFPSNS